MWAISLVLPSIIAFEPAFVRYYDLSLLQRLHLLAQQEFLDLARRRLGQRSKHQRLGYLETGEPAFAEGKDLGVIGPGSARLQFDKGAVRLGPCSLKASHNRCQRACRDR